MRKEADMADKVTYSVPTLTKAYELLNSVINSILHAGKTGAICNFFSFLNFMTFFESKQTFIDSELTTYQ